MRRMLLLVLTGLLGMGCNMAIPDNPKGVSAESGTFDLSTWDFSSRPIKLAGEWNFKWNSFELEPKSLQEGSFEGSSIQEVPSLWTAYPNITSIPGKASYSLRVLLPKQHGPLAIRIPSSDTAIRVFIDGRLIFENGILEGDEARPVYYKPVLRFIDQEKEEFTIVVHAANSIYPRPGLRDSIVLGDRKDIVSLFENKLAYELFLLGAIFLLAIYHFGLFSLRKSDKPALYFSLFAGVVALRMLVTGEGYIFDLIPITWEVSTFFEYLTYYSAVPIFLLFFSSIFPNEIFRWVQIGLYCIAGMFCLLVVSSPLSIYTQTIGIYYIFSYLVGIYVFIVNIRAIRNQRDAAPIFLVGNTFLLLALIHDIMVNMRIIESIPIIPAGFFLFFFAHAFLLSKLFATAFNTAESLSRDLELKVDERTAELEKEKRRSDDLLLNILPERVADALKFSGSVRPLQYESVSVLFSDFVGFTELTSTMNADQLVEELDFCFTAFDRIVDKYGLEKLKTMGDGYIVAGGLPDPNSSHALRICLAASEMLEFMREYVKRRIGEGVTPWTVRIGIHSGPVVAGVIGKKKFAYDIWGDTVNIASRMESSAEPQSINISEVTYAMVKDYFDCEPRGAIGVKGKGEIQMYYLDHLKPGFVHTADSKGRPNQKLLEIMTALD